MKYLFFILFFMPFVLQGQILHSGNGGRRFGFNDLKPIINFSLENDTINEFYDGFVGSINTDTDYDLFQIPVGANPNFYIASDSLLYVHNPYFVGNDASEIGSDTVTVRMWYKSNQLFIDKKITIKIKGVAKLDAPPRSPVLQGFVKTENTTGTIGTLRGGNAAPRTFTEAYDNPRVNIVGDSILTLVSAYDYETPPLSVCKCDTVRINATNSHGTTQNILYIFIKDTAEFALTESFLVNTETSSQVPFISNNLTINLDTVNSQRLNLIATTSSSLDSVTFSLNHLNGNKDYFRKESVAPYYLFGDASGVPYEWGGHTPVISTPAGQDTFRITITPWEAGLAGASSIYNLYFTGTSTAPNEQQSDGVGPSFGDSITIGDFYVDKMNGSDSNLGTFLSPFRTINKASSVAQEGDTILIHAGTYTGEAITPQHFGVTYMRFGKDSVVITNANAVNKKCIDLTIPYDHITVYGIYFNGQAAYPGSNINQFIHNPNGGQYLTVKYCSFVYANGWDCIHMDGGADFAVFEHNYFYGCGTDKGWNGDITVDGGDMIRLKCANYFLFQYNHVEKGGHDLILSDAKFGVFRYNHFDNFWRTLESGKHEGNRVGEWRDSNAGCSGSADGYNVIMYNYIKGGFDAGDDNYPMVIKAMGEGNIVAFNYFPYGDGESIFTGSGSSWPTNTGAYNHIFNNTMIRAHGPAWRAYDSATDGVLDYNIFKNNLTYDLGKPPTRSASLSCAIFLRTRSGDGGVRNNEIAYNMFSSAGKQNFNIQFGGGSQTIATAESNFPTKIYGNFIGNPYFSDTTKVFLDSLDMHITSGSDAIDAGGFLTTVTSASGTGTSFTVVDAKFFFDGYGITGGSRIKVGSNPPLHVTDINLSTNTITVESIISWATGDGVSYPYLGPSPDVGAYEYEP